MSTQTSSASYTGRQPPRRKGDSFMPTNKNFACCTLVVAMFVGAGAATAAPACKETKPGLKVSAKVSCEQAQKTAMAKVPGGTLKSGELEEEDGLLGYSFDVRPAKGTGIEEVQVNAATSEVVSVVHETPADQAAEKKKDAREHK